MEVIFFIFWCLMCAHGQMVSISPSSNMSYCPEQSVDYICTGSGLFLEFIAPPYVNDTNTILLLPDNPPVARTSVTALLTNASNATVLEAKLTITLPPDAPHSYVQCNITTRVDESKQRVYYTVQEQPAIMNISSVLISQVSGQSTYNLTWELNSLRIFEVDHYEIWSSPKNITLPASVMNTTLTVPIGSETINLTVVGTCGQTNTSTIDLRDGGSIIGSQGAPINRDVVGGVLGGILGFVLLLLLLPLLALALMYKYWKVGVLKSKTDQVFVCHLNGKIIATKMKESTSMNIPLSSKGSDEKLAWIESDGEPIKINVNMKALTKGSNINAQQFSKMDLQLHFD